MSVYEKKLKGTQRFLPFLLGFMEILTKSISIRRFASKMLRYLKLEKITRFIDIQTIPM